MTEKDKVRHAARLFKVLGDETRLSILHLLAENEANVSTISERLNIEQSNISHQLKTLKTHRLVQSRREGKSNIYFPDDHHVYSMLEQVIAHVEEDI
ncbi:MAG TPA: metalloregulator ArsR/SmtB family transcription factor [Aliicoccus persicus]|uniref:Metalloregulator ArsR/SmtB family transcription factor n=1 Tax=Aliicoccus persicus TaxID=930138 RepID=A0A921DYU9_9STAP|nr:metalloregulator ArsR/SmtB family transcription factor [Aliicoccus persicus]